MLLLMVIFLIYSRVKELENKHKYTTWFGITKLCYDDDT